MGCPDFAIPSLEGLSQDSDFEICAVYCMPDKKSGRGKQCNPTPIKKLAISNNHIVRCPASLKNNPEEISFLQSLAPDFLVVVAYGLILPKSVLDIPAIGPINLHASLLPALRGPSPIHYALMNGLKETGNTVMLMNEKMDEGDILSQEQICISETDNLKSLHDKLAEKGALQLKESIKNFASGKIIPQKQDHAKATYTKKISTQTAKVSFNVRAETLVNLIKAMNPYPGAWFNHEGTRLKVFEAKIGDMVQMPPGYIVETSNCGVVISCAENTSIKLLELQKPGKKRLKVYDFLKGYNFKTNCFLDSYEKN